MTEKLPEVNLCSECQRPDPCILDKRGAFERWFCSTECALEHWDIVPDASETQLEESWSEGKSEGYEEGYSEGFDAGYSKAEDELGKESDA